MFLGDRLAKEEEEVVVKYGRRRSTIITDLDDLSTRPSLSPAAKLEEGSDELRRVPHLLRGNWIEQHRLGWPSKFNLFES